MSLNDFDLDRYLRFDQLITPLVMRIIYILGVIVITLIALGILIMGIASGDILTIILSLAGAVVYFIFVNILWRVGCEVMLIIFKINEGVIKIGEKL